MKITPKEFKEKLEKYITLNFGCDLSNAGKRQVYQAVLGVTNEILAEKKACSVSQIALAWLLKQKIEAFPIVSASTGSRMEENVKAMGIELSEDEAKWLNLE